MFQITDFEARERENAKHDVSFTWYWSRMRPPLMGQARAVRDQVRILLAEDEDAELHVPDGVDPDLILMVTQQAAMSLLNQKENVLLWLWALQT